MPLEAGQRSFPGLKHAALMLLATSSCMQLLHSNVNHAAGCRQLLPTAHFPRPTFARPACFTMQSYACRRRDAGALLQQLGNATHALLLALQLPCGAALEVDATACGSSRTRYALHCSSSSGSGSSSSSSYSSGSSSSSSSRAASAPGMLLSAPGSVQVTVLDPLLHTKAQARSHGNKEAKHSDDAMQAMLAKRPSLEVQGLGDGSRAAGRLPEGTSSGNSEAWGATSLAAASRHVEAGETAPGDVAKAALRLSAALRSQALRSQARVDTADVDAAAAQVVAQGPPSLPLPRPLHDMATTAAAAAVVGEPSELVSAASATPEQAESGAARAGAGGVGQLAQQQQHQGDDHSVKAAGGWDRQRSAGSSDSDLLGTGSGRRLHQGGWWL